MPTYDYQCRTCGRITEVIHSMLDDGPTTCDTCGGPLRRVIYASGIIFKGSGFYATDSRKADPADKPAAPSPKPSTDGAGSSSSSGTTETAPATGSGTSEAS